MKRRIFLAAASTVGIVGAVSSASLVTSTYSSISTSVLMEEFGTSSRRMLNEFKTNIAENIKSHGLDEKLADQIANPVQIISNKNSFGNQQIVFKNKSGDYISLSKNGGVELIEVLKSI